MKQIVTLLTFSILSLFPQHFVKSQEKRYKIPEVRVNFSINYDTTSEDRHPGFLTRRGDFQKLKEITGNGKGVKVGIVDTGLDRTHSQPGGDLELYREGSGSYAVREVKDFTGSRSGWSDQAGHGSHVAGHIGARKNGKGIEGIASECDLYIAKGLGDQGFGTESQIANAILWLIERKVDIISLSLGGGYSQAIENACQAAYHNDILIFAALGNDGERTDGHPGNSKVTFGVAAVDYEKQIADFSSRSNLAFYSGYGVNVFSCVSGGRYAAYSGTSMATPDQAGIAALLFGYFKKQGKPITSMQDYYNRTKHSIVDLGPTGRDRMYGFGFIDIWKNINNKPINPPTDPPTDPDQPPNPDEPNDPVDPPTDPPTLPKPNAVVIAEFKLDDVWYKTIRIEIDGKIYIETVKAK